MEKLTRKNIRLGNYDYSKNGMYFVTICIQDRLQLLWKNKARAPDFQLSDIGKIIDNEMRKLNCVYENVFVDTYVIMPDHIHMIIYMDDFISQSDFDKKEGQTKSCPTLSRIIKQFKGSITKKVGYSIWQKSFYDEIIRDEQMYQVKYEYIRMNPQRIIV